MFHSKYFYRSYILKLKMCSLYSVQFSCSVVSNSLWPHGLQHARPPCPSPTPGLHSNSCPLSRWCHPTISSSVIPFSSHLQSFPASRSFQMGQFFSSSGQSFGISAAASVHPVNIQDWFPLGLTSWISFLIFVNLWVQVSLFPLLLSMRRLHLPYRTIMRSLFVLLYQSNSYYRC